ncbi:Lsr2 protein [Actinomycetospora succinea]|uniref:Lsr2 protein n=1 Tax=Actinomycetospora succinea TaxID=663603 RepID=A0A4R6VKW8_9PSEU|nr:Lsr2 family protein [Actinomycetospora succinea]TDQ62481.1 Lsr2 protein [Actinomycetospora succinea]
MTDAKREPTTPRERHDADEPVRKGNVHGLVEAARLWARQKGMAVPSTGPLPREIMAQYKRQQTWE